MDARLLRSLTASQALSMSAFRPRQSGDRRDLGIGFSMRRVAYFERDPPDGFEIIGRGGGETGFDNIHAQARQ